MVSKYILFRNILKVAWAAVTNRLTVYANALQTNLNQLVEAHFEGVPLHFFHARPGEIYIEQHKCPMVCDHAAPFAVQFLQRSSIKDDT